MISIIETTYTIFTVVPSDNCYRFYTGELSHNLNFSSVYRHETLDGKKEATTYHTDWVTVDYIFYRYVVSYTSCVLLMSIILNYFFTVIRHLTSFSECYKAQNFQIYLVK